MRRGLTTFVGAVLALGIAAGLALLGPGAKETNNAHDAASQMFDSGNADVADPPLSGPSNILASDYVGPRACASCHEAQFAAWSSSAHSKMNQNPSDATVYADFHGARTSFQGGEATFDHENGAFRMTLAVGGVTVRRYAVTRTVGSRFMQFFVGKQIEGPEPRSNPLYTVEHKLPFAYWFKIKRWLHVNYFDPYGPDRSADGKPTHDPYRSPELLPFGPNCMLCHNTYAYAYRLGLPAPRQGFPLADLAFSSEDILREIGKTVDVAGLRAPQTLVNRMDPDRHLVTLGVSCESCHFGGREHAREGKEPRFLPTSPYLTIAPKDPRHKADGARTNPYVIGGICTQCHSAEGETFPNGAGTINSREALDLAAGGCTSAIKCTDCHDPHRPGERESGIVNPRQLAACTSCHGKYASTQAAATHSGHPAAMGVTCLDCHMPRIEQGLDEVVRTHTIHSPTDVRMLAAGSANACNICHLDRSMAWTLNQLEKQWGKRISPNATWSKTYGETLEQPVGMAWLTKGDAPMRLVASQAYARSPLGKAALPELIAALDDTDPVNRVFTSFAVGRLLRGGRPLRVDELDPMAEPIERRRQIQVLLDAVRK